MDLETKESHSNDTKKPGIFYGMQLCVVQCSVCVLVILLVLCMKYMGGTLYNDCAALFYSAMIENSLLPPPNTGVSTSVDNHPVDTTQTTAVKLSASESVQTVSAAVHTEPKWSLPLEEGVLTSLFGMRTNPFDAQSEDFHDGVDIAASEGTPIAAICDGVVEEVGEGDGYGRYIIIKVDGQHSFIYAHCSEVLVKEQECVQSGDTVALVGNTGRSTGSHLHLEWRENGEAIDPSTILSLERYA